MSHQISVVWTVLAETAPRPYLNCSSCKTVRPFHSSGKVRLNANGKRLDAWLIYKCSYCEATWNRPVHDRVPLKDFSSAEIDALEGSQREAVAGIEFDLAGLSGFTNRIDPASGIRVEKAFLVEPGDSAWAGIDIVIRLPRPSGLRLDRLLGQALTLSRDACRKLIEEQVLTIQWPVDASRAMRRPVRDGTLITIRPPQGCPGRAQWLAVVGSR
ncbi:DUF1062 domain-containing protein [Roseibium sp. RKSG952]|uniref:DUF1062 domain-containing protein n=1 Tax=Roseibium sp. RKSG952 TaxID=2529384 RepID=UPI0012BCF7B5|nr:DUF1062 domain-containing protein [Roseibium sp. RKSG952]MTH98862.1 DUF1062 domain-containing protein [Roseibium sp. RKSG952]